MTAVNNKVQPPILSLPTAYSLTNSSLESNRSDLSDKDVIIGEQWIVLAKIGEGSFGEVFEVKDIDTGRHYAVKREPRSSHRASQVKRESVFYDVLAAGPGIPQCHWFGRHEEFDCIVMDLLGTSLKQLRQSVKHMPLPIIVDLGCQMIDILEHIHRRGLLYRDVKPDNFLFAESCRLPADDRYDDSIEDERKWEFDSCQQVFDIWGETRPKLYVVDLGLATCWQDLETKQPYPECKKRIRNKTGTARYASLNVHRGKTPARRDDMESLGYLLVDLALGSLPWNGIQARSSKAGWDKMHAVKEEITTMELCANLPQEFVTFIDYTRQLSFADEPAYDYLRKLLHSSIINRPSTCYDATLKPSSLSSRSSSAMISLEGGKAKSAKHTRKQPGSWSRETATNSSTSNSGNNDGVFQMDDLATELPSVPSSSSKQMSVTKSPVNPNAVGGRRRRNSKKSNWPGHSQQRHLPEQQQKQQVGGTQPTSRSQYNGKYQQQQQQLYDYHHQYQRLHQQHQQQQRYPTSHQRPFILKSNEMPKISELPSQQQALTDPWARYNTSSFSHHHRSHHHSYHQHQCHPHSWQQYGGANLV